MISLGTTAHTPTQNLAAQLNITLQIITIALQQKRV
jgi:hypothetical protein